LRTREIFDEVIETGQPVQEHRTGAVIRRHFDAVDPAADCRGEQPRGTTQPGSDVEDAFPARDLRNLEQFARRAKSAGMEMVERRQLGGGKALLGVQSGRAKSRKDARLDVARRIV
jgi:hypothetical protein